MNIEEIGFYKIGDTILREPPARDDCFKVVNRDADAHEYGDNFSEIARREMIHRHMANEMTSVDMAAVCVAEFPDAPWGLRMELARQAWDEARHVRVLYRRLKEMGGFKGEFPGQHARMGHDLRRRQSGRTDHDPEPHAGSGRHGRDRRPCSEFSRDRR